MDQAELVLTLSHPDVEGRGIAADLEVSFRGKETTHSSFTSPFGQVEADALRWYLEVYHAWPFGTFRERARLIEADLLHWGRALHDGSIGLQAHRAARDAWLTAADGAPPRITLRVEGDEPALAQLLSLPWELMADDCGFLFDAPLRVRVRRQMAVDIAQPRQPTAPLRLLLVVARPEAGGLPFIDPRATAMPLLQSLRPMGDRVEPTMLPEGTLEALRDALDRADAEGRPFHVVHFDGHGIFDDERGVGLLCWEHPGEDPLRRQVALVEADTLGELLADRRVPLVFLEACQTATARGPVSASVALTLLRAGVGSVVAMSHTVRAISTRRFVEGFYRVLAQGEPISTALGAAQSTLRLQALQHAMGGETGPGAVLQDWFVPVLYQEDGGDMALLPPGAAAEAAAQRDRLGSLPPSPQHGFVGRARDLLLLQRSLGHEPTLTLLGDGGQGKTALAVELARWLAECGVVERVAFVSVEQHGEARGVLDRLGAQLVDGYTVATAGGDGRGMERAAAPVLTALERHVTMLVVDNLESVMPAPGEPADQALEELLTLLEILGRAGQTRLVVTSREAPPPPLDRNLHRIGPLSVPEGMRLVAQVLEAAGLEPPEGDDETWVERLVAAVGGHPRSLVLLARPVAAEGIEVTARTLARQMQRLEMLHPGQRERSLVASVQISLDRLPDDTRRLLPAMAVFRQNAHAAVLAAVLGVSVDRSLEICGQLVDAGLAGSVDAYLLPDPALVAALAHELSPTGRRSAEQRWLDATVRLVEALYDQHFGDAHLAAQGADITLSDTLAALDELERRVEAGTATPERAANYATCLEQLVTGLGRPRVVDRVVEARRRIARQLTDWTHEAFAAEGHEVMRCIREGELDAAVAGAETLLRRSAITGDAYPEARYDQAMARWLSGRALQQAGRAKEAMEALREAEARFLILAGEGTEGARRMASVTLAEQGEALRHLGQLEEAAATLRRAISMDEERGDTRQLASVRLSLGIVRTRQGRWADALETFQRARVLFEEMDAPSSVANAWHQIGTVYGQAGQPQKAERAYQRALRLRTQTEDAAGEAVTLVQLGNLYRETGRDSEAVALFTQAADILHEQGDPFREAGARNNLGVAFHALGRLDEARGQLTAAIDLLEPFGFAAQPWKSWAVLADVERDAGRSEEARAALDRAKAVYLGYRQSGGEPLDGAARLVAEVGRVLSQAGATVAASRVPPPEAFDDAAMPLRAALVAALRGSPDRELAARFPYTLQAEFELWGGGYFV